MLEFLSKFQGRGIKIALVNSIGIAKQPIFFNILRASVINTSHPFR